MPSNLVCPHCGEENPANATMCWACYSPLPGTDYANAQARARQNEKIKNAACWGLGFGALASWLASGYFPKRRGTLIGAGAAATATIFAWGKWDEHKLKNRSLPKQDDEDQDPIHRILNTILLYAARDGATQIRVRAGLNVRVHYLINDEWQEQIRIPDYIWMPMRKLLLQTTNQWQKAVPFQHDEKTFEFWPEFKHNRDSEYPYDELMLSLDRAHSPAPSPEP